MHMKCPKRGALVASRMSGKLIHCFASIACGNLFEGTVLTFMMRHHSDGYSIAAMATALKQWLQHHSDRRLAHSISRVSIKTTSKIRTR